MDYPLSKEAASLFESIKHNDENGIEFWYGRELAPYLGYTQWRNFESVIEKAKEACKSATGDVLSYFADASKIVKAGASEKPVQDYKLTRYACYLIAQNGDPRKEEIAEEKLRKNNIKGKEEANDVHYNIGVEVRKTIERIGGIIDF